MEYLSFCERVRILNEKYNFSGTSWFRSTKRNKDVGGHPTSKHLVGKAIDIVLDNPADKMALTEYGKTLGLRVIDEVDHLHIQPEA